MNNDTQREAFEAWIASEGITDRNSHRMANTRPAFDAGWQAREPELDALRERIECMKEDYSDMSAESYRVRERVKELEKDAAIGAAVRPYFASGNSVPVERATIRAVDIGIAAIAKDQS